MVIVLKDEQNGTWGCEAKMYPSYSSNFYCKIPVAMDGYIIIFYLFFSGDVFSSRKDNSARES